MSLDAVTVELLDKHLPCDADQRRAAAVAMLLDWAKEDDVLSEEAVAENAALLRAFDEQRPSYRRLFENFPTRSAEDGPTGAP